MKQKVTISMDKELIQKARVLAAKKATSISRLLSDELTGIIRQNENYERARRGAIISADFARQGTNSMYPATLLRTSEFQERHQLSFWDAMIVAAAYERNAKILFSEDLHHGRMIEGLRIVNPLLG